MIITCQYGSYEKGVVMYEHIIKGEVGTKQPQDGSLAKAQTAEHIKNMMANGLSFCRMYSF